jgi:hypothetical protein
MYDKLLDCGIVPITAQAFNLQATEEINGIHYLAYKLYHAY